MFLFVVSSFIFSADETSHLINERPGEPQAVALTVDTLVSHTFSGQASVGRPGPKETELLSQGVTFVSTLSRARAELLASNLTTPRSALDFMGDGYEKDKKWRLTTYKGSYDAKVFTNDIPAEIAHAKTIYNCQITSCKWFVLLNTLAMLIVSQVDYFKNAKHATCPINDINACTNVLNQYQLVSLSFCIWTMCSFGLVAAGLFQKYKID